MCLWVGSGSWQGCISALPSEASCVFLAACSVKGLICCSAQPHWCWVMNDFFPTAHLRFGQNVHPRQQKGHLKLNGKTSWKHLLSHLGQRWLPATASFLCLKSLQCCWLPLETSLAIPSNSPAVCSTFQIGAEGPCWALLFVPWMRVQ